MFATHIFHLKTVSVCSNLVSDGIRTSHNELSATELLTVHSAPNGRSAPDYFAITVLATFIYLLLFHKGKHVDSADHYLVHCVISYSMAAILYDLDQLLS